MKKVFSLILCLAMVLSLVACKNTSSESNTKTEGTDAEPTSTASTDSEVKEPVDLNLWSQFADPNSTDGNFIAFYKALDGIKTALPSVNITHDGTANDPYKTKLKTAMAANELPDIFFTWGAGFAQPMVEAGLVLPLDEYLDAETLDKLVPGTLTNFTYDGKVYGLPYSIATANLYCNKELFDKYNLKLPETYEDLLAAVDVFNQNNITPIALAEKDLWPGLMMFGIFGERAVGAQAFNDMLVKKSSFDSPDMIAGAQKLKDLFDTKAFGENPLGTSYDDTITAFKNGQIAMMYMGTWVNGDFEAEDSKVKGKITTVKFPTIPDGKGNNNEFLGGCGETFMISADTKDKDAAVAAVKYICETMSKEQYLAGSGAPAWKGDMGDVSNLNVLSVQTSNLAQDATGFVYWLDMITNATDAETIKNTFASFVAGELTPEEFCKELQKMNETN